MRPLPLIAATLLLPTLLLAQKPHNNKSGYDNAARATVLHTANVYVTADSSAPPITTVGIGHEVVVSARNGNWINVFANTDTKDPTDEDSEPEFTDPADNPDPSSGWIRDKGVITPATPNGDLILFGAAADLEAQAAAPHPPADAAAAAHRLYQRVTDYFPNSPLAAEALFRSADIRWQLDKLDISTLPSAHEQDAFLRPQLYEGQLKKVLKLYPDSPFAARAAFDLLDNKLCGDWQGLPKCPEQESQLYLKYADHYPGGPKSAEALYDAAYRQGALVSMYEVDEDHKRSADAAKNCQSIADELRKSYPQSDYTARAQSIAYRVAQGIPIFGSDRD
jgi:outer membrane protein assembly factor BamD (BamD/ComL family)